ncbi:MAG: S41 family peptidase [Candidatus Omnitrophota bacterium]|jgi:carboxyl-terminal processing protease
MRKKLVIGIFIVAVCSVLVYAASQDAKQKKEELFKQVGLFSDTLAIVESDYVDEVNFKNLIYGALKGMLASLDPHSQFLDPDTYNELKVDTEGKFGGLGIEITVKDGLLTVVTPIEDTPAWKAGVKAGDRIVKIENDLTRDMTLTEAVKKLRGKPGEAVKITVLRESEKRILEIKIVRDIIKIKDIKEAKILEAGISYIRLVEFRENTAVDLDTALKRLDKEGAKAVIFDLRNNPGGLLDVAVDVTGKFIEKGKLVVYTKGRRPSQNLKFLARSASPVLDLPMVVLINEGSASGSEIVAGALQDYKRAIVVGVKSFGKGSVQTVIPLSDGSALRLTTSKYYTPSGKEIHGKGVMPDIVIEEARIETPPQNEEAKTLKPADVFDQMESEKPEKKPAGKSAEKPEEKKDTDYKKDLQLVRAVDVLKAIMIYRENEKVKNP